MSTLRDADDIPIPLDPAPMMPHAHSTHSGMLPPMNDDLGRISDTVNTDQDPEDDMDPGKMSKWHLMVRCEMTRKHTLSRPLVAQQSVCFNDTLTNF